MNCYDNIECFKCVNTCDVLTFGLAPETGSYTFTIIYNDNERLFNLTFTEGETIELPAYELNENGTSIIVVTFGETIIAACKIKVSIGYIGNQSSDDIDVGGCPTLCQRIEVAQWSEIKACMNDEQIDAAIEDLCDIECEPVTYTITRDNLPFANGSVPSGGNLNFNVPSDCPPPTECDPLEITFGGYPLITVPEPCGETVALSCDSLTIHAYVDDGAEVTGVYYKDGSNYVRDEDHFIFYNGTAWEIEKTGGNIASANGSEEFPWQADWSAHPSVTVTQATIGQSCGGDVVCDDATAVLKDTAANVLSTTNIPSGTSQDITAPDSTLTVNIAAFTTARSGEIKDIGLINEINATITPISLTGGNIKVYTGGNSLPIQTGNTTSVVSGDDGTLQYGSLLNWFQLTTNHEFGHNWRFVGTTGGYNDSTTGTAGTWRDVNGNATTEILAFPNGVILDMASRNQTTVMVYARTPVSGDATTVFAGQPYTYAGLNKFRVANNNEVMRVFIWNNAFQGLDWWAFGITLGSTSSSQSLRASTGIGGNHTHFFNTGINSISPAGTRRHIMCARLTFADLGIVF